MSQAASPTTSPQPEPGPDQTAPDSAPPAEATPTPAADNDAIYEQAFANFLAPDAPEVAPPLPGHPVTTEPAGSSQNPPEQPGEGNPPEGEGGEQAGEGGQSGGQQGQEDAAPGTPELSEEQTQLLRRLHMTPEMIAPWSPEQQQEFLQNAAKRERDQTREFKRLREAQGQSGTQQGEGQGQQASGEGNGQGEQETPAEGSVAELAQQANQVAGDLVDVYGEEIKPLTDVMGRLASTADQLQKRLDEAEQDSTVKDQLIAEVTVDSGVRGLVGEFPSLEKPEARQRVIDRFEQDWKQRDSKHRTASGPLLQRVQGALRDAAQAEFGNQTESAAQVALANKNKERLRQQPQAGSGRGRAAAKTQDDVYDDAFNELLAPELNRSA